MIRRVILNSGPDVADLAMGLKSVPVESARRLAVRQEARRIVTDVNHDEPISRDDLLTLARSVLHITGLPDEFAGFVMVQINNEFWRDQLASVPFSRRLLLLPHCLRHHRLCKGAYSDTGLTCAHCGACPISGLINEARSLGYAVQVAEGTPSVLQVVLDGGADAVIGVACLDSLEKAFKRIVVLGVPHAAVPLLRGGCADTTADLDEVRSWIHLHASIPRQRTHTYVPLLQASQELFRAGTLDALLTPELDTRRASTTDAQLDPNTGTRLIALDWLRVGGKRFRPFITLAAYAARTRGPACFTPHADLRDAFPDAVQRAALAVEALHKASLVHDDIEDDDAFRYGRQTLHRQHGPATAVNVGDYLVGLGYRLIASGRDELSAPAVADMLQAVSLAHMKLSEGQGAELLWRDHDPGELRPLDVLQIYALKTAPAFEAAMFVGLRAAGPVEPYLRHLHTCCRYLGVAYQILNDLKDWSGNSDKLIVGQDLLALRPTILHAFALEAGSSQSNRELVDLVRTSLSATERLQRIRRIYEDRGVFHKAGSLAEKYRKRARACAQGVEHSNLRELLHFIVDIVLS